VRLSFAFSLSVSIVSCIYYLTANTAVPYFTQYVFFSQKFPISTRPIAYLRLVFFNVLWWMKLTTSSYNTRSFSWVYICARFKPARLI